MSEVCSECKVTLKRSVSGTLCRSLHCGAILCASHMAEHNRSRETSAGDPFHHARYEHPCLGAPRSIINSYSTCSISVLLQCLASTLPPKDTAVRRTIRELQGSGNAKVTVDKVWLDVYGDPRGMRDCASFLQSVWVKDTSLKEIFTGTCLGTTFYSIVVPIFEKRFQQVSELDPERLLCAKGTRSWLGFLSGEHIDIVRQQRMHWPRVLLLHLKRDTGGGQKDNRLLRIPFATHLGDNGLYLLRCIIVHEGKTATSGHFTAYVWRRGRWYYCSDESYRMCSETEVERCQVYLAFYVEVSR